MGPGTLTVQVASLISAARQLQLNVSRHLGAGGQCWCDEIVLLVHTPPLAYCNQVPNPALPKHVLKGLTNRLLLGVAAPCQQKDNHNLWLCSSLWVSVEHNPIPALSPSTTQHTQECTLILKFFLFLNRLRWQKEGSWSHKQQLLCGWPFAVLQFLLLKHWFQMVLDTKMEKSKPPCETSFQKKRISLKKEGRCDRKTQPLPRAEVSSCSSTCDGTWYMDPLERHREELQSDAQRTWKSELIIYTDNCNTKLMNSKLLNSITSPYRLLYIWRNKIAKAVTKLG